MRIARKSSLNHEAKSEPNVKKYHRQPTEDDIDKLSNASDMKLVRDLCGFDTVVKLMREMPGTSIYVPNASARSLDAVVRRMIIAMQRDGLSVKRIALAVGRSEGWVYAILRKHGRPATQEGLNFER